MGRGADRRGKKLPAISKDDYSEATLARIRAEQLYAITAERRLTHPAIVAISASARLAGFNPSPGDAG